MKKSTTGSDECAFCARAPNENNGVILRKCSKCLLVFYCSKECQREHWFAGEHKRFCLLPKERKNVEVNKVSVDEFPASQRPECSICQCVVIKEHSHTLPCAHTFHFDCLYTMGKLTPAKLCPICRSPLPLSIFTPSLFGEGWRLWISVYKSFFERTGLKVCSPELLSEIEKRQVKEIIIIMETMANAGKEGKPDVMYSLGVTYQQGFLVFKDPFKAAFWHGKAAKKGCAKSQTEIGIMYYHGRGGLDINMKESLSCFRAAAEQGEPEALHRAAIMLRYGCGCNRDDAEAYTFFEISAFQHNNLDAHFEIGLFLYEGLHLSRCWKKAAFTFLYCAFLGHSAGQYMISECYLRGHGVKQDEIKAMFWKRKADSQNERDYDGLHEWLLEWIDTVYSTILC